MVISFSLLTLSLVNASLTQVGKRSSETNSVMPPQVFLSVGIIRSKEYASWRWQEG